MFSSMAELVPSSARSSTSAASPLPTQLVPLLADALERVKRSIDRILPTNKKRTALEEAEYEDEDEDTWSARGRKKPKPGRQVKPPKSTKKPKREPRRGF